MRLFIKQAHLLWLLLMLTLPSSATYLFDPFCLLPFYFFHPSSFLLQPSSFPFFILWDSPLTGEDDIRRDFL